MKFMKTVMLCALTLSLPVVASAGSATGTVTSLYADTAFGDLIYVELSGLKSNNPSCSTGKPPYQFVLPRTATVYFDMLQLIELAQLNGQTVTVTGAGSCGVDFTVETVLSITQ